MTDRHSDSSLSLYRSCPLKYRLARIEGLQSLQPGSRHDLDYGKAVDAALNTLYSPNGTVKTAQEAFAEAYPADEYPTELPRWSQGKSFANGLAAIAGYARRWYEDDQHWDVVRVQELESTGESEYGRVVRLDLVVRDKRDGLIYGCDNKSTGKYLDSSYWTQFEPHSQIRSYALHLKQQYGSYGGFYINAISFRHRAKAYTPRKGPQKGVPLPAGDWFDFARVCFNPNSECLALEAANTAYWINRIEQDTALGIFGYNTAECHRGGIECEFWKICSAGWTWPGDEEIISNYYRQACLALIGVEDRCQLDRGHQGPHSPDAPKVASVADFAVFDDNEEQAEDAVI